MTLAAHCDGPTCDSWHRVPTDLPHEWLTVAWGKRVMHMCSWDCLLKYGAGQEPLS